MNENTLRVAIITSKSSHSLTSGLKNNATKSVGNKKSVSKTLPSDKHKKEFRRGDIKSETLSLPTVKNKKITKKETKKEDPTESRRNSSKASEKKEKRTPNNVKESTKSRTSSLKRPVAKADPKIQTLTVSLQGKSSDLSSNKSQLSATSKVSSWSASQRSSVRDDISRDYLSSQLSALTTFSNKTQISTVPHGGKKPQIKFWGPNDIHKLKDKPKESEQSKEDATRQNQANNLLKANKLISQSNSEEESMLEAENLISKPEEPAIDKTAERNVFIKFFGSLMDINDISSTETLVRKKPETEHDFQYVRPVDRLSDESGASETSNSSIDENKISSVSKAKSRESIDISFDLLIESEDEPIRDPSLVAEAPKAKDISVLMKDMDSKKVSVDFQSGSSNANNRFLLPLMGKIEAFIDDLLKLAAKLAFKPYMRRVLDSSKLIDELTQLAHQYTDALQMNNALNEAISEYFIKRKEFAYVDPDGENESIYRQRFMETIETLDLNFKRERETKLFTDNLLGDLRNREKIAKSYEVEKVQQFEARVRESLLKDGFDRLGFVMDDLFRKMNETRNEVTKSRHKLVSVQKQLATIKIKSEEMEQQGTGVSEYLANQAVIQTLSMKICDRDAELIRLKDRVTYNLHTMAHLKEKEESSRESLEEMKKTLKSQRLTHKKLRDVLYAGIQRRKHLKKEIENVRRGSLLNYPAILRDYDATEEYLRTKQEAVHKLRSEYNRLTRKLTKVESDRDRRSTLRASRESKGEI